ncbi:unnamed protein product [Euphydryas editha]|uniref:Aminopeptidase n=1 Tax=Euphydryas editha TaxID=104508 RepID=A0AAU9V6T9_EUPED|nr:unnamed protein product [Euphydryas editha]
MARTKFKCQFVICVCLIFTGNVRSLPIPLPSIETTDSVYSNVLGEVTSEIVNSYGREIETKTNNELPVNRTFQLSERSYMRPGQSASRYNIHITRDGDTFRGRAVIDIQLTEATRGNQMFFNLADLVVSNVQLGVLTTGNAQDASFAYLEDEQRLRITPLASRPISYVAIIEYSGNLREDGFGLYRGQYGDTEYVAMNLHATNARRVFPCLDEPNLSAVTSFTFEGFDHETILSNAQLEDNEQESSITFRPLEAPSYLWGMVAHNLQEVTQLASTNARLYVRPGINSNLHSVASIAISDFYNNLNVWTGQAHSEMLLNQNGNLHVMTLPDVSRDWYALSTICIWEPYVLTEERGSVAQRKLIFVNIAESMARQWFGYMLRIENWRYQWISSGLTSYSAYEIIRNFQTGEDIALIDMDSIFTTDVIQESLLRDSYASARPIQTAANIYTETDIRQHINGILKYKAPAILRMVNFSLVNPPDNNFIRDAARILLETRAFVPITSQSLYDAIESTGVANQSDFISTWVTNPGYPIVNVSLGDGGLTLRQRRFGFSPVPDRRYHIPITYTTESEPQFDNIQDIRIMTSDSETISVDLGEDWIIINLQGQGYYRVNYSPDLWERIILALEDTERRENIHLLNRASLVDDSFNLARAGELNYEIALRIALTMENELDYAVWRAFIRNMDFLKKRLIPFVSSNDDLDDEIYLRLIRRIVTLFEEEIDFTPSQAQEPAMRTLTRGLVMDHACRSGYDPCIAAAVDLFYNPNDPEAVNPNIPHDLRPAVYCTMVMEGDESVREALDLHMSNEVSGYERLVILQALACSQDEGFINEYLTNTVSENSPYALGERLKIFEAVASSSVENAGIAFTFLRLNTNRIRNMYGGSEKLEEALYILGENLITEDLVNEFQIWINSIDSIDNLGDSRDFALRVRDNAMENIRWNNNHLQEIYEWIDLNHAPSVIVSTLLLSVSIIIALFIH